MEQRIGARVLDALAEDKDVITYRPKLRALTRSALGVILLQQILHRAKNQKWKPFFKFASPCGHADYRAGDSWTEELGFSEREFEAARECIASKITHGRKRSDVSDSAIVLFWTDSNRKTWYEVNCELLELLLAELYGDESAKGQIALYLQKRGMSRSRKRTNRALHSPESTETTDICAETAQQNTPSIESQSQTIKNACGHPVNSIVTTGEGTNYCAECAANAAFDALPSASRGMQQQPRTAATADARLASLENESWIFDRCQEILPMASDSVQERKSLNKAVKRIAGLGIPRDALERYFGELRNGGGARLRGNPSASWYLLAAELRTRWQRERGGTRRQDAAETTEGCYGYSRRLA